MILHWLTLYGYTGLGVFGLILLYRVWLCLEDGDFRDLMPHVHAEDSPFGDISRTNMFVLVLGLCLVAWPLVVVRFLSPEDRS